MRCYLAGPMRGYAQFNFPAFYRAADELERAGHVVFNPAARDVEKYGADIEKSLSGDFRDIKHLGFSLREALSADLKWICEEAEAVALLPGWQFSKGARAEFALAEALGLEVIFFHKGMFDESYPIAC